MLKRALRKLVGDYAIYVILRQSCEDVAPVSMNTDFRVRPTSVEELATSDEQTLRDQAHYAGDGALAFVCVDGDRVLGACFYWFGSRYARRGFWPLAAAQAKLVQIITLEGARGRGVARTLITSSCEAVAAQGFTRVYARVWHSNAPSLRAFAAAGWRRHALVVEVAPSWLNRRLRVELGLAPDVARVRVAAPRGRIN